MLLVIVGEAARRAALERAAEAYRPGIPAEWALNAAQAAARLREEPGSILMLDLGLPACALFAFQELDAAPVCAGTLEELSAAPAWLPRRMAAFLPLEASAAADGGTMPAAPAPLWAYLSDLSRGCGVTLAQSQRAARLLGVPARGRLLTALYAEPCPTRAAATAAERALRENGFQDVCFVPWGQGCMGILNPGQAAGAMEKLCLLIRRALHTQGGRAVTIGLSRAESDPERLPALTEQAELSTNYLCHLFKKETGFRVVEYINLIRMERAKELLRARGLSAAQTADAVGFSDTAYFCTMFKRYTGLTVTDFRNRMA